MTVKEAAAHWGCTEDQVRKKCRENTIPGARKVSGVWVIPDVQCPAVPEMAKKDMPEPMEQQKRRVSTAMAVVVLVMAGLCLLGSYLILHDWIFFGGIILLIGAAVLTFLSEGIFTNLKEEFRFIIICLVSIVLSLALFGAEYDSGGTRYSDLSDVEKKNAEWAYEANQFIDSYK